MLLATAIEKQIFGRPILAGADLSIDAGETVALLGENGAGKSTLLRIVAGVIAADAGSVTLNGEPLDGPTPLARRRTGYLPEAADPFPHLALGEYVALTCALKRVAAPAAALVDRLGLANLLSHRMGGLSLGQRRRAGLLAALAGAPRLLLLDEPTNGLDAASLATLASLLAEHRAGGGATLLATHDRAFADRVATRQLSLARGRLVPA